MDSSSSDRTIMLLRELLAGATSDFEDDNCLEDVANGHVEVRMLSETFDHRVAGNLTDSVTFPLKTLSLNVDPSHHRPLIDPTYKLDSCDRFKVPSPTTPTGSTLKLKMIKQYPSQQIQNKPVFELADVSEDYEKMEENMILKYSNCRPEPLIDFSQMSQIPGGSFAVIRSWKDAEAEAENLEDSYEDIPVFKRIKILSGSCSGGTHHVYKVEYIDYFTQALVDSDSDVMHLDKSFAVLPPRVCNIEMEGLSFYKDGFTQKFVRYDSEEYAFNGILTAEVQESGQVVVWSKRFPKERFPYGINGFIIDSILESINLRPILPPVGHQKPNGFVVHSDKDGNISIQFDDVVSKHFLNVFSSISETKIRNLFGSVVNPQKGEIYLAPHSADGTHYRAVILGAPSKPASRARHANKQPEVRVQYLDYGDEGVVKVKELVNAKDIHYMLSKIPQQYVKAHLANICAIKDNEKYFRTYHGNDEQYIVHVIKAAETNKLAEVILKKADKNGKLRILNERIVEKCLAKPVNTLFNYTERFEDHGPQFTNWSLKPSQHLEINDGAHVKVGDELVVEVMYDKNIPGSHFFMIPLDNLNKLIRFRGKPKFNANLLLCVSSRVPGFGVVCASEIVGKVARGILLEDLDVVKAGSSNNLSVKSESKSSKSEWYVYLPDYGVVERCNELQLSNTKSDLVKTPYFGCLAYDKKLDSKEKLRKWWSTQQGKITAAHLPIERLDENGSTPTPRLEENVSFRWGNAKNEEYETQSVRRTVKILGISKTPFGDVMEVDWCNDDSCKK